MYLVWLLVSFYLIVHIIVLNYQVIFIAFVHSLLLVAALELFFFSYISFHNNFIYYRYLKNIFSHNVLHMLTWLRNTIYNIFNSFFFVLFSFLLQSILLTMILIVSITIKQFRQNQRQIVQKIHPVVIIIIGVINVVVVVTNITVVHYYVKLPPRNILSNYMVHVYVLHIFY